MNDREYLNLVNNSLVGKGMDEDEKNDFIKFAEKNPDLVDVENDFESSLEWFNKNYMGRYDSVEYFVSEHLNPFNDENRLLIESDMFDIHKYVEDVLFRYENIYVVELKDESVFIVYDTYEN